MCEIDIRNPKYTTFTKLVQVRNFITFELKVIRHEVRETQSFYAVCFYIVSSQPNQRAAPVAHKFVWPRPALNLNFPVRTQELNSLLFLKSLPTLPVRDVTYIPWSNFYLGFLFWHLWMTHPLRARVNTCVNVAPNWPMRLAKSSLPN